MRADSADSWTRIPMVHDSTGSRIRRAAVRHQSQHRCITSMPAACARRNTASPSPTCPRSGSLPLELHYPAYTGLPPQKIENGGDVVAVTGTTALLDVDADAAGHARVRCTSTTAPPCRSRSATMAISPARSGWRTTASIASTWWRPTARQVPGTVQHSVEALVDHPPTIRIDKPGRDTRVTSVEEVPMSVRASDDYGVRDVRAALHGQRWSRSGRAADRQHPHGEASTSAPSTRSSSRRCRCTSATWSPITRPRATAPATRRPATSTSWKCARSASDYHAADDNGGGWRWRRWRQQSGQVHRTPARD